MTPTIALPTTVIMSEIKSPKRLIMFSKPKVGKTTLLSKLPNCLILDFEDGSDYVDALKVKIIGINPPKETDEQKTKRYAQNKYYLVEIGKAIKDAGNPYDYVAVDTSTALEDLCVAYAEELYSKTAIGKYWFVGKPGEESGKQKYGDLLSLPEGLGYRWLRIAFEKVTDYIQTFAPRMILSGHIKDIYLDKNDTTFTTADIDLTGKIKRIASSKADAIGYLARKGKKTVLSFKTSDEVNCGARPDHLRGQEITLSEEVDGMLVTYWEKIYID
jgi:hypothetical protein